MGSASADQWLERFRNWPWHEARSLLELVLYFLAVVAILGCLIRLGTIRTIIRDFREARGPIWDLRNTVNQLMEVEPVIRALGEQVSLLDEKVEAARKQVAELQVEASSTRTEASEGEVPRAAGLVEVRPVNEAEDQNWLKLRDTWKWNTLRLEHVIDQISDGRRKVVFDRLPRTNYDRIINKLQGQGLISAGAANASRSLNELFYRYRPRNRAVPDEVIGSLGVLNKQLDRELVPIAKVLAADEDDTPQVNASAVELAPVSPMSALTHPANGGAPRSNLPGQSGS